jgi:hypothetical protein
MRKTLLLLAAGLVATPAVAADLRELWSLGGFAMPESALYLPGEDVIVVSNIGAFGPDAGADGYLARMSADGALLDERWVDGLTDPRGMAAHGGRLYVADNGGVHVIALGSGAREETIALDGALFPNDVAVGPGGAVFVTDMLGGAIWRLADGAAEKLEGIGPLPLPNGILGVGETLVVGSFGEAFAPDSTVTEKGGLLRVDPATGRVEPLPQTERVASVDGIVEIGGWLVYDDNPDGRVYAWKDGANVLVGTLAPGVADLGAMGDVLIVPNLDRGTVTAYRLEM